MAISVLPMIKGNMMRFVQPVFFLIFLCFHLQHNMAATDRILPGQQISMSDTIISGGGVFELGFFSPGTGTSGNYYVGIWHKRVTVQRVVWIANRNNPLTTAFGFLTITADGNLMIADRKLHYMVTNSTSSGNTSAVLLDSGNLVLNDHNSVTLWQSFDNPSHVFLPGMKMGINKRSGEDWSLVSWRSTEDPASGEFSLKMDGETLDQLVITQKSQIYWSSGPWNGEIFSLVPEMRLNHIYNFSYVSNENETYFTYSLYNSSTITLLLLDVSGLYIQFAWLESTQKWLFVWSQPRQRCDTNAYCGSFGVCSNNNQSVCDCLYGFQPRDPDDWLQGDRTSGCVRNVPLRCKNSTAANGDKDKFFEISYVEYPENPRDSPVQSAKECKLACSNNCDCVAYAYNSSHGCSIWDEDLLKLRQLDMQSNGGTIYLKLAASELPDTGGDKRNLLVIVLVPVLGSLGVLLLVCYISCRCMIKFKQKEIGKMEQGQNILLFDMGVSNATTTDKLSSKNQVRIGKSDDSGLPLFTFSSVSAATDDFSAEYKLGEGGFGPVYMGKLREGHKIAVKRLSKISEQGLKELKNEAELIAKLQHKNLVKLVGCCLEQEEKILIYEYMPNKSLDKFLFEPTKRGLLDWETRVGIIEGIAQGLLYLHQYSRLKIIHRDLKASNILLDADMNPKISDFGMARIFGGNETQANTKRISGTYGYMAPEYALEGIFSVKSDVFSFGVLLLEILSGQKNTGFYHSDSFNLLGYACGLWQGDRALDLMDPILKDEPSKHMLLRYINVALLCVQDIADDRPTMSDVVSMLKNEVVFLPSPKELFFPNVRSMTTQNAPTNTPERISMNDITVSLMKAR